MSKRVTFNVQKITAQDILDKCKERTLDTISDIDFKKWIDKNLSIKKYVGINIKYAVADLLNIITNVQRYEDELMDYMIDYDITKLYFMLNSYIGIEFEVSQKSAENYDLIFDSGLFDYIMTFCERDYISFEKIIDNFTGHNHLALNREMSATFKDFPTTEKLQEFQETMREINPEVLGKIEDFNTMNDPLAKKVTDIFKLESLKESMKK